MAEIDKLLSNIVARGVERATIISGQSIVLQRGEQKAQGAVMSLTDIFQMLREIVPDEDRTQLAADCAFKFPYKIEAGYFDIVVLRRASTLQVTIRFAAPALGGGSASRPVGRWAPRLLPRGEGHYQAVTSVAFSPDGALLASSSLDGAVHLWDVATGQVRRKLCRATVDRKGGASRAAWSRTGAFSVAFSPDGRWLAAGLAGGGRLWDIPASTESRDLPGYSAHAIRSLCFSPDNRLLASGTAYLEQPKNVKNTMAVLSVATTFLPGGETAGESKVGSLVTREVESGKVRHICALWKGVRLKQFGANMLTLELLGKEVNVAGAGEDLTQPCVVGTAFSPDNRTLASADNGGNVKFFDTGATTSVWKKSVLSGGAALDFQSHIELDDPLLSIQYSPDGKYLLVLSNTRLLWYDIKARRIQWQHACRAVAACLVGAQSVALAAPGRKIRFVSPADASSQHEPLGLPSEVTCLYASHDGRLLACGCDDGSLHTWRLW